ncbi:hypothetical protein [Pseudomonas subflava]|uniref:hypothetical protein n=1 Tax=Pseudomonas subflava TaxID=2952933 RepID=UPI00207A9F42|nr:hypothetical protein [Pseudomonas subflava]
MNLEPDELAAWDLYAAAAVGAVHALVANDSSLAPPSIDPPMPIADVAASAAAIADALIAERRRRLGKHPIDRQP